MHGINVEHFGYLGIRILVLTYQFFGFFYFKSDVILNNAYAHVLFEYGFDIRFGKKQLFSYCIEIDCGINVIAEQLDNIGNDLIHMRVAYRFFRKFLVCFCLFFRLFYKRYYQQFHAVFNKLFAHGGRIRASCHVGQIDFVQLIRKAFGGFGNDFGEKIFFKIAESQYRIGQTVHCFALAFE